MFSWHCFSGTIKRRKSSLNKYPETRPYRGCHCAYPLIEWLNSYSFGIQLGLSVSRFPLLLNFPSASVYFPLESTLVSHCKCFLNSEFFRQFLRKDYMHLEWTYLFDFLPWARSQHLSPKEYLFISWFVDTTCAAHETFWS